jgi:glycosyltransferase involved in cell wall biosynthesis
VKEIVRDGISGYVCRSVLQLARRATNLQLSPLAVRQYVEEHFSLARMVARYIELYKEASRAQQKVA